MHDIIIIGGGCAGLTAAVYAARAGRHVLVIESDGFGGQITAAPKIENFPAVGTISGMEFADKLTEQALGCGIDIELDNVISIKDGDLKSVITESEEYIAKAVIIATGSRHRTLGLDREDKLTGHGVSYCAVCDGAFFKDKIVAVAGGGNTAFAEAIYLSALCKKVYIIHRREEFRAANNLVEAAKDTKNIEFITNAVIEKLNGENTLCGITLNKSDNKTELDIQGLFVAVGRIAKNDCFADIIKLDENGYIIADETCHTSVRGIFAAGDCRTKSVRQLTTAASDGAVAATEAAKL